MTDQQTEPMKVYELAKELGLDSFALLDKLKQINIEVKSHMSPLEAAQAEAVRAALRSEKKGASGAKTDAPVKKKAGAASASGTATAPAKKLVKKTSPATSGVATTEANTAKPAAKALVKAKEKEDVAAAGKKRVIKRRTGAEGEAGEATSGSASAPHETTVHETADATAGTTSPEMEEVIVSATESSAAVAPAAEVQSPVAVEVAAPQVPLTPKPAPKAPREEVVVKPNAPGTRAILRTPGSRVLERDELLDEFTSRRLKIVQVAPPAPPPGIASTRPSAPTYRTPGGPTGEKKRTTTGGSATPTTPQAPTEMFQPMTSYVAKEDEGKNKRGGLSSRSQTPEEIRIADFRKRELVFQPKRKKLPPGKIIRKTEITERAAHKKKLRIEDKIIVSDLAQRMGEKANQILGKLVQLGSMVSINQTIDFETASLIAQEFGWEVENIGFNEVNVLKAQTEEVSVDARSRPPIITVMGHVDHGKTSLLDAIRNENVAGGEAGGITQHIGAYSVIIDGNPITFLDTPGHEAFANMRSRGANLTDIVVLVVAADDSIMPQTKEAISHALAAEVPIIVAANKMDKPDANIERLKKDLSINNVLVEDWGGQVPLVPVSALKKTGLKELLETIALQAEMLELKANPEKNAEGVILEARMEKGRGVVADLLVQNGTLRGGDHIVVGTAYGRIRAMVNDKGKSVDNVLPGFPVEIIGLNEVPASGDTFYKVDNEEVARDIAENRRKKLLEEKAIALAPKAMSLEDLMAKIPKAGMKELNLLIKTDVYGSAEAIKESIEKIKSEKVTAKVIQCSVGVVTENDVLMAKTSGAMIIGFNSKPDNKAREAAKREKVDVKYYSIIYELLDAVREAMENLLEPIRKETPMGKAEVKQVFTVSKLGTVAGSVIVDGKITRNAFARVTRGKDIVAEGKVVSLRRFKDDVGETIKGQECGIGVERFEKYLPGDVIQAFHVELVKQTL